MRASSNARRFLAWHTSPGRLSRHSCAAAAGSSPLACELDALSDALHGEGRCCVRLGSRAGVEDWDELGCRRFGRRLLVGVEFGGFPLLKKKEKKRKEGEGERAVGICWCLLLL